MIFQRFHNFVLVFGAKGLHGDTKLHSRIPVGADKLIVIQLDNVALCVCDGLSHPYQFTRLVRKQYRYREDPVSLD